MKVVAYIKSKQDGASYYRLYQYEKIFKENDIDISIREFMSSRVYNHIRSLDDQINKKKIFSIIYYIWGSLNRFFQIIFDMFYVKPDVIIIQRTMFSRKALPIISSVLKKYVNNNKVIWDFDDNILFTGEISEFEYNLFKDKSKVISIPNNYLKKQLNLTCTNKVMLVPTLDLDSNSIDKECANKSRLHNYNQKISMIWIGTHTNLKFVYEILPYLDEAAKQIYEEIGKKIELKIICNKSINYDAENLIINNIVWSREKSIQELEKSHIGIMPLRDTEVTRGKAAFKAVQYLGAGVPVLISPVGYNKEIIEQGKEGFFIHEDIEWISRIKELATDEIKFSEMSKNANIKWMQSFNAVSFIKKYIETIKKINEGHNE